MESRFWGQRPWTASIIVSAENVNTKRRKGAGFNRHGHIPFYDTNPRDAVDLAAGATRRCGPEGVDDDGGSPGSPRRYHSTNNIHGESAVAWATELRGRSVVGRRIYKNSTYTHT